ncbi:abc transporter atp-binding protein albc-related [Holotrichia oblita]|nr:abc transporter atp-binding protein albc-related [Holotrichia oblita]
MDILEIKNFSKSYSGTKKAVDNLNITVSSGDIYGFIGHNGAGKTTTIRSVVGIMDFEEGEITICGHLVKNEPILCKSVTGYIPDNPDLYDYITGIQYLNYMADMFNVSIADRKERIEKYAQLLGMTNSLGDLISSYSHGMKQKTALIGAFLHKPKLLVLDEPFVGLDPEASFHLKNMMRELCNEGAAIFFSTHVLEVAEKLCGKIAIIKDGKLKAQGKTQDILGDSSLEEIFLEVAKHDS